MVFLALSISIFTGFYLIVVLLLFVGTLLAGRASNAGVPMVSVVIPAKNEEDRIEDCLYSLMNQDYPKELLEIVVVNDRSTDKTGQIIREIASMDERIKLVDILYKPPNLTGKQNALEEGLKLCKGEIILNTDADCVVPPGWVRSIVDRFGDGVGMVIGFTLIRSNRFSLMDRILSLDMLFLLNAAAGAAGLDVPVSCIGNNIGYRSDLIRKLGGFSGLGKTITEDAELIQAVRRMTNWKVEPAYDPEAVVYTLPIKGVRNFLNQRARWIIGGFKTKAWTVLPIVPILILYISIMMGFILSVLWRPLVWISSMALGTKFLADFILTLPGALRLKKVNLLLLMPIYELLHLIYPILVLLYAAFIGEIRWKEDIYRI